MAEFMAKGPGEAVESVLLPNVDHLWPPSRAAHDTPHAVAELVSILLRRQGSNSPSCGTCSAHGYVR